MDIHDHLRSELTRLHGLLDDVRRGVLTAGAARSEVHAMSLRQNNWTLGAYCQSYCGFVNGHHSLEDASVFPHLRRSEPDVAPVLDRLAGRAPRHPPPARRVDPPWSRWCRPGTTRLWMPSRSRSGPLGDRLLSHLAYEERELRGPLARHGFY